MPIKAAYTWSEKKDTIKVLVPLKGVSASKADIIVSSSTLKVNFAPYLLDLVLLKEIDSLRHKASVKDGVLHITLCKKEVNTMWGTLEAEGDKETLMAVKRDALLAQENMNADLNTQRSDRRHAEEKHALRKQMKLEEMERNRVDHLKQEEKESAEQEVYAAFAEMQMKQQSTTSNSLNTPANPTNAKPTQVKTKSSLTSANTTRAKDKAKKHVVFNDDESAAPHHQSVNADNATVDMMLNADDIDGTTAADGAMAASPKPSPSVLNSSEGVDDIIDDDDSVGDIFDNEELIRQAESGEQEELPVEEGEDEVLEEEEEIRYVPPPRSRGLSENADQKIDISFTPRVFPTPMRESKAAEEEDWVAKNRRHLKKHGVLGKGGGNDVSEEDPVWLKAKGDDFFRAGDMRSALNAYSAALDADPSMLPCLANRSVCYLRIGLPRECHADCTLALAQIHAEDKTTTPAGSSSNNNRDNNNDNDDGNRTATVIEMDAVQKDTAQSSSSSSSSSSSVSNHGVMAVKLLMRRGTASCQLGAFTEALTDFTQASGQYQALSAPQLHSMQGVTVETLAADVLRLKILVSGDSLKKEADSLFAEGNSAAALAKYNAALEVIPVHVGCLSNRAALKMALQDFAGCVEDCTIALVLLQSDSEGKLTIEQQERQQQKLVRFAGESSSSVLQPDQLKPMMGNILPAAGSDKRRQWTVKTLLRRGVALTQLQRLEEAVADYARASALDENNAAIRADLQKITALRDAAATTTTTTTTTNSSSTSTETNKDRNGGDCNNAIDRSISVDQSKQNIDGLDLGSSAADGEVPLSE
mmetsp:Transcript_7589/g.12782  ORF Transcript_7589/g.12782 Transcript_7589/m.12782 type:complete len:815 (-) Transcript_7589:130-2574(-)